jgi:hypothetical protein
LRNRKTLETGNPKRVTFQSTGIYCNDPLGKMETL